MQMNNPLAAMIAAMRNGGNPMQIMQEMAAQNPQAANAMRAMQGKNPEQLRQMVENMCRERHTTPEALAQEMGIPFRR